MRDFKISLPYYVFKTPKVVTFIKVTTYSLYARNES